MKNDRGFTLAELIVTMAITSLLVALAAGILVSSMNSAGKSSILNEKSQFVNSVYGLVFSILVDSPEISQSPAEGAVAFSVSDGRIYMNGMKSYDDTRYFGCGIEITVSGLGDYIELAVTLRETDGSGYTKSGSFRLLNTTFSDTVSGNLTLYFVPGKTVSQ